MSPLRASLWLLAVVGTVADIRLLAWYWPGSFFDSPTSGVWAALAWDFAHGRLYRPLISAVGYGGTRYMPALFVMYGALFRAHVDPIVAGVLLMQATTVCAGVALFAALTAMDLPRRLAAPIAALIWCTILYQKYATDLRVDYLAAACTLAAVACASRHARSGRSLFLAAAILACTGAALAKLTSAAFAVPIAGWLWSTGRRRSAAWLAGATMALVAGSLVAIDILSRGVFHENMRATLTGGMSVADVVTAAPRFLSELIIEPLIVVPFAGACWLIARRGAMSLAAWYFISATVLTVVIYASPGTARNHLVEPYAAALLLVGSASMDYPRVIARGASVLAAVLAAVSWPLPGIPSVIGDLRASGPRPRTAVAAVGALIPGDAPYVSLDPTLPVLLGQTPTVLDPVSLTLFVRNETAAGRDFAERVRARGFSAIVVRDHDREFPGDLDASSPGFEGYRERFWAARNEPMMQMIRGAYDVHAVRPPFVVLTPAVAVNARAAALH